MRYFEIVRPPVRYVLADAKPRETAPGQTGRISRPSRQQRLSPQRSQ